MINKAQKEIKKILDTHKLTIHYELDFPMYKKLPDEVQLALRVLAKHGMDIRFVLRDKK